MEGLLHDFFHSALPNPWPAPPTRAQNVLSFTRSSSWKRRVRSALALAASMLIIAFGLAFLSGKFSGRSPDHSPNGPGIGNPHPDQPHHGTIRPDKK